MKLFSKLAWAYGTYIVISASFTLQILNFLNGSLGENNVRMFFYLICILILILIIFYIFKSKPDLKQILILIFTICFAASQIFFQTIFAEKTHVITYGLLGYLATGDAAKKSKVFKSAMITSFCFIMLVNILDEAFQGLLSYRVGSLNDIFLNALGGLTGILFYFGLKAHQRD